MPVFCLLVFFCFFFLFVCFKDQGLKGEYKMSNHEGGLGDVDRVTADRHSMARMTCRSYIRVTKLNLEISILAKISVLFNSTLRLHAYELSINERVKFTNHWKSFFED